MIRLWIACIFRAKNNASVNDDPLSTKLPQMNETPDSLLATDEPPPFTVDNDNGIAAPHRRRSRGEAFSAAA
jgi:hypothetical protein